MLPKRAETLTKAERAAVLSVVDAILGAAGQDRTAVESLRPVAKGGGRSGGTKSGSQQAGATARRVRKGQDPLR